MIGMIEFLEMQAKKLRIFNPGLSCICESLRRWQMIGLDRIQMKVSQQHRFTHKATYCNFQEFLSSDKIHFFG